MRRLARGLVPLGLSALGVLVVHQLAYLSVLAAGLLTPEGVLDHGHISMQWAVVTPIAVLAAAGFIVHQIRSLPISIGSSFRLLAPMTGLGFVIQESVEHHIAGQTVSETFSSPAVIVGVLLTPFVVGALVHTLSSVAEFVAAQFAVPPSFAVGIVQVWSPFRHVDPTPVRVLAVSPRGPPIRLR